jgi:hypothetical protein
LCRAGIRRRHLTWINFLAFSAINFSGANDRAWAGSVGIAGAHLRK